MHLQQDRAGTPRRIGGGVYKRLVGGSTWTWDVLRHPHRVSAPKIEELVKGGRLRGQMQKFKGGEFAAEFPPQSCCPGFPPKIGVAGGAAHVEVDHIGAGVEGCCLAHNIVHPPWPRLVASSN